MRSVAACRAGSGAVAVLVLVTIVLMGGIAAELFFPWEPPSWLLWPVAILTVPTCGWTMWETYRCAFKHCRESVF